MLYRAILFFLLCTKVSSLTVNADELTDHSASSHINREHIKSISVVGAPTNDFNNEDGSGLYTDILKAIYEPLGIKLNIKKAPASRAVKMVSNYHIYNAVVGIYHNIDEDLIFPDYPIYVEYLSVLSVKQKLPIFKHYQSLSNKTVGWMIDYELIPRDKRDFQLQEYFSTLEGVQRLNRNKIDYLIDEQSQIQLALDKAKLNLNNYSTGKFPIGRHRFIAFSNNNISKILVEIYNQRTIKLAQSGELKKIYDKWRLDGMPNTF